jgi:hypothetical protein
VGTGVNSDVDEGTAVVVAAVVAAGEEKDGETVGGVSTMFTSGHHVQPLLHDEDSDTWEHNCESEDGAERARRRRGSHIRVVPRGKTGRPEELKSDWVRGVGH